MWNKQQKKNSNQRTANKAPSAKVFSYYQSRSISPDSSHRETSINQPAKTAGKTSLALTTIAFLIVAACLVYITTLQTSAVMQIAGEPPGQGETIVKKLSEYEPQVNMILEDSWTNKSKIFIDTSEVSSAVQAAFPELGSVNIELPLVGRKPVVKVNPADAELVIASRQGSVIVDSKGMAIAETSDVNGSKLGGITQVQDESGLNLRPGEIAITEDSVIFIRDILYQFDQKQLTIKSLQLPSLPQELHIRLVGEPYFIKFNLRGDSRLQAGTYFAIRDKLEEEGTTPSEYVDARVEGKAFYK